MIFRTFLLVCLCLPYASHAQRMDLDVFGGISNYQGDLQPQVISTQNANFGWGAILKYGITEKLYARAGFSFGRIAGEDATNKPELRSRNLNFRNVINEFSAGIEYRFFSTSKSAVTPYLFVAGGIFTHNPYTFSAGSNERVYLQPLGTEGQGLAAYPEKEPYPLTQFCVPYGAGLKWQINCNLNLGLELRQTLTFTDYLDDVSGTYADQNLLRQGKGQLAVDLAWRRDEFDGTPYPAGGSARGNPEGRDFFYFVGFTLGLKINDCESGRISFGGLIPDKSAKKYRVDCPKPL